MVAEDATRVDGSPRGDDGIGRCKQPPRDLPVFDDKGEHLRHAQTQTANRWQLALPGSVPIARHTSLRTTFPPTAAIEFAVVVAATAAPSPARLVAVMVCSSHVAAPVAGIFPITTELPTMVEPKPTPIQMPVAGEVVIEAVSVLVSFDHWTSTPPIVWQVPV